VLPASVAETRNISRREVCFCEKLNFIFFSPFFCASRSWTPPTGPRRKRPALDRGSPGRRVHSPRRWRNLTANALASVSFFGRTQCRDRDCDVAKMGLHLQCTRRNNIVSPVGHPPSFTFRTVFGLTSERRTTRRETQQPPCPLWVKSRSADHVAGLPRTRPVYPNNRTRIAVGRNVRL
jgi:hypothetical protein